VLFRSALQVVFVLVYTLDAAFKQKEDLTRGTVLSRKFRLPLYAHGLELV